jgi:Fe-S cluster biogenesis protein NfuA
MTEMGEQNDFEDRVYAAVSEAEEQFRAEDAEMLKRENFPYLDDAEYAAMLEHLAGTYKGVEIDWVDPYTKTVVLKPEGGCSTCSISTMHIQRAIGQYLTEHVDPDIRVTVKSSPQADF